MHPTQFSELTVCGVKEKCPSTLLDLLQHAAMVHDTNEFRRAEYKAFSWLDENGATNRSLLYQCE